MSEAASVGRPCTTVLVCRGCCCGTDKQPDTDHEKQLAVLEAAVDSHRPSRFRVTNCLGPCGEANVVAIRHRDMANRGARLGTTWLARVLDDDVTTALADWIATGCVRSDMPALLSTHVFDPVEGTVTPDNEMTFVNGDPLPS